MIEFQCQPYVRVCRIRYKNSIKIRNRWKKIKQRLINESMAFNNESTQLKKT